jgi:predicted nucleic acid-binding protein
MFMASIYLDYNCFQRGFDDSRQIKIHLEALACQEVFAKAESKEVKLAWSFMHEDENSLCPFIERKIEVLRLSALCESRISPRSDIRTVAKDFQQKVLLSSKDSLHLSCAHHAGCTVFLTCDEELIRRAKRLNLPMRIMNPVDYVRGVEKNESAST